MSIFAWYKETSIALRLYILLVLFPTIIAALYYGLYASDEFISEAKYAVRSNNDSGSVGILDTFSSLGLGSSSNSSDDAMVVRDYIMSRSMLQKLSKLLPIKEHYSSSDIDYFARLDPDSTFEDFLAYYDDKIQVDVDTSSHITTLQVSAYSPEMAKKIADAIIQLSEELVNTMSDRIVEDTIHFARSEVNHAEERVKKASEAITDFRNKSGSINPDEETSSVLGIITGLESSLATAKADLINTRSFMQKDSPQVKLLETKVESLEKQVKQERKRLADTENSSDYTRLIDTYEPLALEQELAKQLYSSTLTSLELAKAEAQRKQRYLLTFVPADVPDEALKPERGKSVLIIFLLLTIVYAIGGLVWAAIKDHMRI